MRSESLAVDSALSMRLECPNGSAVGLILLVHCGCCIALPPSVASFQCGPSLIHLDPLLSAGSDDVWLLGVFVPAVV